MPSINLIAWDNGFGLTRELGLVKDILSQAGFEVHVTAIGRGKLRKWLRPLKQRVRLAWMRLRGERFRYDANLMLEHVRADDLGFARKNLFVPNPEWCSADDVALLGRIDLVLAKTRHAEPLFRRLGCPTAFVGWTSADRLDASVPRERAFFHLAGRSSNKGTERLLALWRAHPQWPRLTVLQNPSTARPGPAKVNIEHRIGHLDDAEVRRLQNAHRFHLCPSETEGFGHYLMEAISVGAVTLTTDAPPMNELVTPERGLLAAFGGTGTQHLATTYFVDDAAMTATIERALAMSEADCEQLGRKARQFYLDNDQAFRERLLAAVRAAL